jgi:signal transduction histidine kinase
MDTDKTRQLMVLMETSFLITSIMETAEITKRAIASAVRLLQAEAGSLLLIDCQDRELFFEVALGASEDVLRRIRLPYGTGIAGWVAEHGIPQLVNDVRLDDRWCSDVDASSGFATREIASVPVRFKEKTIGVLEAINRTHGSFVPEDLEVLQTLANQVAVALENARLFEENIRQYEQLLATEKRHQEEKEKLLKDLHDGVGGLTSNINLLAELGQKGTTVNELKTVLATIAELSREGMGEIRTFMNALEDSDAGWTDLVAEMRRYGHAILDPHGIAFVLEHDVAGVSVRPGIFVYLSLFRMFKESLANVVKHANAMSVVVDFTVSPSLVSFTVRDDGRGFAGTARAGRGIANMRTRARELGGELQVDSHQGTVISLNFPTPLPDGQTCAIAHTG